MAKVKIQGNASGTGVLTVTAPNTSTDRTVTLPDATGTLTFTPGITDNSNATAITIDSSERVGFGTTTPQAIIVSKESTVSEAINFVAESHGSAGETGGYYFAAHGVATPRRKQAIVNKKNTGGSTGDYGVGSLHFLVDTNTDDADVAIGDSKLEITSDGRGLSQFTAKAWCNINQSGTQNFQDGHNVSSVSDQGVGNSLVFFTNNMSNDYYSTVMSSEYNSHQGIVEQLTATVQVAIMNTSGNYEDRDNVNIVVFGD